MKEFKDANLLDNASRLIFQFNRIPRLTQRMECHELSLTWEHHADVVSGSMSTLVKSLKEMADAKSNFEKILAMVLAIGNYINGDTARGQVSAHFEREIYCVSHLNHLIQ